MTTAVQFAQSFYQYLIGAISKDQIVTTFDDFEKNAMEVDTKDFQALVKLSINAKAKSKTELNQVIHYFMVKTDPTHPASQFLIQNGAGSQPACLMGQPELDTPQPETAPVQAQAQNQQNPVEKLVQVAQNLANPGQVEADIDAFDIMYPAAPFNSIEKDMNSLFDVDSGVQMAVPVRVYPEGTPALVLDAIPAVNPHYKFEPEHLIAFLQFLFGPKGRTFNLFGHKGSGKSEFISQVCANLRIPCWEVQCSKGSRESHFFGSVIPMIKSGNMQFVYQMGPVNLASFYGGVCSLDEVDMVKPEYANVLHRVMENKPYFVTALQKFIPMSDKFRLSSTSNTNLTGDMTGGYKGTSRQNEAFVSRIDSVYKDYLNPWDEYELLISALKPLNPANYQDENLKKATADLGISLVKLAEATRVSHKAGVLASVITTRHLIWIAIRTLQNNNRKDVVPVFDAIERVFLTNCPHEKDKEEIRVLWKKFCPKKLADRHDELKREAATKLQEKKQDWDLFSKPRTI